MYTAYIELLRDPTKGVSSSQHSRDIYHHSALIIEHLSQSKHPRSAPSYDFVSTICTLKQICNTKKMSKFELIQKLIPQIIIELRNYHKTNMLKEYAIPECQTPHAKSLFSSAPATSDVIITQPEPKSFIVDKKDCKVPTQSVVASGRIPLVGTKHFQSIKQYNEFVTVGQHPINASPCVCPSKIFCKGEQLLVYEEWQQYIPTNGQKTWYVCRRRRKPSSDLSHSSSMVPKKRKSRSASAKGVFDTQAAAAFTES